MQNFNFAKMFIFMIGALYFFQPPKIKPAYMDANCYIPEGINVVKERKLTTTN